MKRSMTRDQLVAAQEALGMNSTQLADWLGVSVDTTRAWRRVNRKSQMPGPAILAIQMELERRGIDPKTIMEQPSNG